MRRVEMITGLPSAQGKIEFENRDMKRFQAEWSNPPIWWAAPLTAQEMQRVRAEVFVPYPTPHPASLTACQPDHPGQQQAGAEALTAIFLGGQSADRNHQQCSSEMVHIDDLTSLHFPGLYINILRRL